MSMRSGWSVAIPAGGLRGGAGLGNQAIVMGKAWIGAQVLNQSYVEVPWGQNPRGYSRELGTNRLDWVPKYALRFASRRRLGADEYLRWGGVDYEEFLRHSFNSTKVPLIVSHASDMVGGFASIVRARGFLRARLLGTKAAVQAPMFRDLERQRLNGPIIAVHFRAGDFADERPEPGTFNRRIPAEWYADVLRQLYDRFGTDATYLVICEGDRDVVEAARAILVGAGIRSGRIVSGSPTSDLRVMVESDILVCSISSFSMLAAFLSGNRYVWYAPHLSIEGSFGEIWPEAMRPRTELPAPAVDGWYSRAVAAPFAPSDLQELGADVERLVARRNEQRDLMIYGRLPVSEEWSGS